MIMAENKESLCEKFNLHLPSFEKGNNTCIACKQNIETWLKSQKPKHIKINHVSN
jgi:hypothetical protein